jgi:hypothetical protein
MTDVSSSQPSVSKSFWREFKKFSRSNVLVKKKKKKKKKKKLNKSPCTSRHARKFDPFSIMHENFHRSYRQGNWGVTVGSRVNLIRAQRTLARLEARKLFRPNIFEVERLRTRIRGLRDLRVRGSRIRGSLFETFSDDKGLEFEASET